MQKVLKCGGFEDAAIVKKDVYVHASEMQRDATMLWSFIKGTGTAG